MKLEHITEPMDSYPENEAALTYQRYLELIEDEDLDYANEWLHKQKKHMNSNFDNETDVIRYNSKLNELIGNV